MVKEDVEDLYEFQFSLQFYSRFSFTWHLPRVWRKSELAELFRIPCSCGRSLVVIIGYENFLPLNLYVIRMSLSTVFVLLRLDTQTLWLWNLVLSFDLLSKWLLSLELIPSSQKQNDNGDSKFSVQFLVTSGHWQPHNIICGMHCADTVFTNMYLLGQRHCNLFQRNSTRS